MASLLARNVIASCQRKIGEHPNDCSAFVKAVAGACGVILAGDANSIVASLPAGRILMNGPEAMRAAADGSLVIAGRQAKGHGHVVVVVDGPLDRTGQYPYSFWGQYRGMTIGGKTYNVGFTRGHGTLNYAFSKADRDSVVYAAFNPIESLMKPVSALEGRLIPTFF